MGKTITSMKKDEVYSTLVDKIADYHELMIDYGSIDSELVDKRMEFIADDLRTSVEDYYNQGEKDYTLGSKIQGLMDDEYEFLNFFTKSSDKRTSGIEFYDGDRKLFDGINKQVSERVIKTLQFRKDKLGEPFEVQEIGNPNIYIQSKDSVVSDINGIVPNLFSFYFLGDGAGFYHSLQSKGLTDKDITAFSGVVDLSEQNNENYHNVYDTIMKKARSQKVEEVIEEEIVDVKKRPKHM